MGGTYDPPERNDDQNDDLKAGEEVSLPNIVLPEPFSPIKPTTAPLGICRLTLSTALYKLEC